MLYYVRNKPADYSSQSLNLNFEGCYYYPIIQHATLDQDRPMGDKYTFRPHTHNLYHIVLYTRPGGFYHKNNQDFSVQAGMVVLVSPKEVHEFHTNRGEAIYSEITFSYETHDRLCLTLPIVKLLSLYAGAELGMNHDPEHLTPALTRELRVMFRQLTDYLRSDSPLANFHSRRTLGQIFTFLITNICKVHGAAQSSGHYDLQQVKHHIETHFTDTLRVGDLAERANLSPGYFLRLFKKTYGVSPIDYQQSLRIETAKTLLRATHLQCNEIAHRVGYEDVFFFHRVFKKNVGMPPKQYRLSELENQPPSIKKPKT
ncbi:MAG: helix-turn-helix transcriptional regulator [Sedimentisphaerales bacterium]|nr:helix-turn-helix transcriptional regulator [Sedimentisphaerales bacterium]